MRSVIAVVVTCGLMAACSDKSDKNDFAGFSFESSRKSLESKGFICKDDKEKDKSWTCTNLDWSGTVFGINVKGMDVGSLASGQKYISVNLTSPPRTLMELVDIQNSIDRLHDRIKKEDVNHEALISSTWMRTDKSTVKFVRFQGIGGLIPARASFTAHSPV